MQALKITLKPLSAFGTPVKGDTFFGQFCSLYAQIYGGDALTKLLLNYKKQPFIIFSDAFPAGYIPLPTMPNCYYQPVNNVDRKVLKKHQWLPVDQAKLPLDQWLHQAKAIDFISTYSQMHNQINRLTDTTGKVFAPFSLERFQYQTNLDQYIVFDPKLVNVESIKHVMNMIGHFGYGKDATVGMGKFELINDQLVSLKDLTNHQNVNAVVTLAPSSPQGQGFDANHSFYQCLTRFGKHGGYENQQKGKPFKAPVLLAETGSVFYSGSSAQSCHFIGQGLGGAGEISNAIPETVVQGYAPAIPIHFSAKEFD